jgi:hypothetical protein
MVKTIANYALVGAAIKPSLLVSMVSFASLIIVLTAVQGKDVTVVSECFLCLPWLLVTLPVLNWLFKRRELDQNYIELMEG